jgi:hypothetical protein
MRGGGAGLHDALTASASGERALRIGYGAALCEAVPVRGGARGLGRKNKTAAT